MNTEGIGSVCVALGAGRQKKEDAIDPSAGIVIEKKTGDYVKKGDVIAILYCSDEALLGAAEKQYRKAVTFSSSKPNGIPLLLDVVE